MILSFKCAETEKIFKGRPSKRLPSQIHRIALRKLTQIATVTHLQDLTVPPRNMLEALKRDRKGQHSIRINDQWRICFRWDNGNVYDVEIVDYHK